MEYNQFKQLLALKGIRQKETVSLLNDFIDKFPYCQTTHLLYAKALHDQNSIHYDQHLKLAAAYAPNREVLRDLIEIKTEEVEFEFPLSKKDEQIQEFETQRKEEVSPVIEKSAIKLDEWYSEDEISGRAFEEQKEKEKHVDPHEVIKQRLNEILGGANLLPSEDIIPPKTEQRGPQNIVGEKEINIPIKNTVENIIVPEEITIEQTTSLKSDPEESVYPEEILAEKKLEEELIHPTPEKSEEEKVIIAQAGKAKDALDRMELEHALEESILDSLEKLPIIAQIPSLKEKGGAIHLTDPIRAGFSESTSKGVHIETSDTPRTFTGWLKTINTGASTGFEEVRAPKNRADVVEQSFSSDEDEQESLLSDDELIEKFLLEDPKINPSKAEFYSPVSQAKKSVMDHDDVVSETLAKIYMRQGNTQKARWCYEKLILLHPEKSAFFAALLKEIPEGSESGSK